MTESAAAQSEQQHGQVLAVRTELAVALDDLHFPAVYQAGAARGHPGFADRLRHLGAAFDRGQDLGIETVDLMAQIVDVGRGFGFDCHWSLRNLIVCEVWGFSRSWSHPVSGLTQETSPGSQKRTTGLWKQLSHGHRWPVPVEKSTLHVEHGLSVPLQGLPAQRCRRTAVSLTEYDCARD